jgi:hypothetical protein
MSRQLPNNFAVEKTQCEKITIVNQSDRDRFLGGTTRSNILMDGLFSIILLSLLRRL